MARYFNDVDSDSQPTVDSRVVSVIDDTDIVTLAEAKNYIRINHNEDDALITNAITQATLMAEVYTYSDIKPKQREMSLSYVNQSFNLFNAPIESIDSVTIDGVETTNYEIDGIDNPTLKLDVLPSRKVLVTYTTKGISDVGIKQGILSAIAYLYYGRDSKMNSSYKVWLAPYKTTGFYGVE